VALWDEIDPQLRTMFNGLKDMDYFHGAEREYRQELFAAGFGFTAGEYTEHGLDPIRVGSAREVFFAEMGVPRDELIYEDDTYAWDDWRAIHDYGEK
jgi:tetrahydromethanopterin S-methyltransferase subunit E